MKKIFTCFLLSLSYSFILAQPTWTWLQGDAYTPRYGVYGIKGVADSTNKPGARTGEITWKDDAGNIWIFGGNGISISGTGYLNDLWKYTPSNGLWTWISGDPFENQLGVYGTQGVASPSNRIRARGYATSWMDASGDLWLFGGKGSDDAVQSSVPFIFNDLWKFSISTGLWTWMGGDTAYKRVVGYAGSYGTKGIAAASNKVSSRWASAGWTDASGNFWLFGGEGRSASTVGVLNDLWKYSVASGLWTWMGGDTTLNQPGNYGTKGVASATNKPGSKVGASTWKDASGNLLIFGGRVSVNGFNAAGYSNDLWRYSPTSGQWTWISGDSYSTPSGVYGSKGVPAATNKPGGRSSAASWMDASGNLVLYGGSQDYSGSFNDLWKYNPTSNQWTWLNGEANFTTKLAVYGGKNIFSDTTRPAAGNAITSFTDSDDNFRIWTNNYMFKYASSVNQWAWVAGDTATYPNFPSFPAVYGTKGIATSINTPGARQYGNSWMDAAGNFWLFGGYNSLNIGLMYYQLFLNDLWKYSPVSKQWTWVTGDSSSTAYLPGYYGTKGVESPLNNPKGRQHATSWKDNTGNFWLLGGEPSNGSSPSNDFWKFSPLTGMWTWMGGDSMSLSLNAVYGTRGVAASANKPGVRAAATSWTDNNGNLWLYGGRCSYGYYNDLWKYSPSTGFWTWVDGSDKIAMPGYAATYTPVYGQKGVAAVGNTPGGRYGSVSWTDASGNLWLFGGTASYLNVTKSLNDLWKYAPTTGLWTWMSGDNTYSQPGNYGTQNIAAPDNRPAARNAAYSWIDASGNMFLFGGNVDSSVLVTRYFNDVWKYSPASNLWTWLSGDNTSNQSGFYGTQGVAAVTSKAGARNGSAGWVDGAGNVWLYGGYGYPMSGIRVLNDFLKYTPLSSLPIKFTGFSVQQQDKSVLLKWSTAQEQNSRAFIIERSANGEAYTTIGDVTAAGNASFTTNYSFTDMAPIEGDNFYRLKEVDFDGAIIYSDVKKITLCAEAARFNIINNPVIHDARVNLVLPSAQKLSLQIRDVNGRLLFNKEYMAGRGNTTLSLSVDHLVKGTYFINIDCESLHSAKTFLKR